MVVQKRVTSLSKCKTEKLKKDKLHLYFMFNLSFIIFSVSVTITASTSLLCYFEHFSRSFLTLHLLPSILRDYLSLEDVNQSLCNER